jgi:hypothetical protein
MSGRRKHAKRDFGCPLDGGVRRSLLESSGARKWQLCSTLSQPASPEGGRAVCQSVPEQHDQATFSQRAHVQLACETVEGAPLNSSAQPKTTESGESDSTGA